MSESIQQHIAPVHDGLSLAETGTRYLSFSLGKEEFALPLMSVREVIAVPSFTPIPQSPPYFLGVMNLRGQVISAIDLRKKLSLQPREKSEQAVIIITVGHLQLGILVDSVDAVINPNVKDLSPPPQTEAKHHTEYVTAVYRKKESLVLIVDVARLLNINDWKAAETRSARTAA